MLPTMHPILILLSLFVFAGCLPNPESIKEEVYEQQRADYLALRNFDDKRAVDAFDHYFDANQFRRKYWIHMSATPTNGFWWYPVTVTLERREVIQLLDGLVGLLGPTGVYTYFPSSYTMTAVEGEVGEWLSEPIVLGVVLVLFGIAYGIRFIRGLMRTGKVR